MARTVTNAVAAPPRTSLSDVCGHPVKAELRPHADGLSVRECAAEALTRSTPKQEAAAQDIGISRPRLAHKLSEGTLTLAELDKLPRKFAAEFGQELVERFGPLRDPLAQAKHEIRTIRERLDVLAQFLEFVK